MIKSTGQDTHFYLVQYMKKESIPTHVIPVTD